jgi:hypothetical protein
VITAALACVLPCRAVAPVFPDGSCPGAAQRLPHTLRFLRGEKFLCWAGCSNTALRLAWPRGLLG